ncbi:hypothetical protein AB6A40_005069 [Gnathostoma spinigerum]|uniref:Aminopeptidase n=1 Tax=Gnathostoma spinigerum TaxID=75299 RepID=A0ABD6EQ24_9BILA
MRNPIAQVKECRNERNCEGDAQLKPIKFSLPTVKDIVVNETLEMVVFYLTETLREGQTYYFQVMYSGPIDKKLAGLYLTRYKDANNKERFAAVTQMEPTDARRMAPCFDEPEFRAVWNLKVIHPIGTVAISNGIELEDAVETEDHDWLVTTFAESPPMSSYLVAVAVTDFVFNEGQTNRGTRFRIWSRKEAVNQTHYALQAGIKAIEFFEQFYNISFPLKKQDMIALSDFAAGAMENWGLITYRERYLLYDDKLYTPSQKAHVALVVAHELAHQWFGNLVTMKWWNDLWLNEGFATFMEYLGAQAISDGNFRMEEYFVSDALSVALVRDSLGSSHPLFFPIDKAEDVSEAFDSITYQKGASILHMIQEILGMDNFKKGLNIYLNRFKYSNAENRDLWSALNDAVPDTLLAWDGNKLDINDFASKWTEQMGYPVVTVKRLDDKRLELHQARFKLNNNSMEKEKYRNAKFWYKYDIPIWFKINGEEQPMQWLHEGKGVAEQIAADLDDIVVLNSESRGFYRVNYDHDGWMKIIAALLKDPNSIQGPLSRARIVDDAFVLAQAGLISYEIPLNLSQYLVAETEFLPWTAALDGLGFIQSYFGDSVESEHIREFLDHILAALYQKINWDLLQEEYLDESKFFEHELEYDIIAKYCSIRNLNCTEQLSKLFQTHFLDLCQSDTQMSSECSTVPVPVRGLAYCEGVRSGAERVWNKIYDLYSRERVQVERERLLAALTCSRDSYTLNKLLAKAWNLNDTSIRLQDASAVFTQVGYRDVGSKIIFDYFQDNWPKMYDDLREQQTLLTRIVKACVSLKNERQIKQFEDFTKKYRKQTRKLDVFAEQMDKARTNKLWMDQNFKPLSEWLKNVNAERKAR